MFFQKADAALMDGLYAGLSDIDTVECIAYATSMSMNSNEFTLVQVADNADVEAVKAILQARIDYMVGDGNGRAAPGILAPPRTGRRTPGWCPTATM